MGRRRNQACRKKPLAETCESLRAVRSQIDTTRRGELARLIVPTAIGHAMADRWNTVGNLPARLIVLTAFGHGDRTRDGIAVVPLTALKP